MKDSFNLALNASLLKKELEKYIMFFYSKESRAVVKMLKMC